MRIAVISDLHLGRRDAVDHFGHDDFEFLRFLRFLEAEHERVILLGDVFETLTAKNPILQSQELMAARAAHPEIVKRFAGPKYTYVHGNHDFIAGKALGAPDELDLHVDGVRLHFTHGHFHDWMIRRARVVAEVGVCLGAWLRRLRCNTLFRFFDALDGKMRGAAVEPSRCSFQRWALEVAHVKTADVIVTGHTHLGLRQEHGAKLFLNSGHCSKGNFSFLSLDTRRGEYGLHAGF